MELWILCVVLFSALQNLNRKSALLGVIFSCLYSAFCRHEGGPSSFSGWPSLAAIELRIEVDAVGDSDEHVAVGDAAVLGHTHAGTAASGTGDEAASFPNLQGAALVVAYPDGWGLRCRGALFDTGHLLFLLIPVF